LTVALTPREQLVNMNNAVEVTYFLLRIVSGLLFFQAGAMKLFGWFGGMPGERRLEPRWIDPAEARRATSLV
jgi:uncharacterized membrane protein YphA (DoxX/SURF4 family)